MSRLVRRPVTLFGFAFFVLLVPLWWWARPAPKVLASVLVPPPDFKVLLLRAGLSPEALAAAAVSANSVSSVVSAASESLQATPTALALADTAYASARVETDRLKNLIESGRGSQEDVAAYQAASAALATATTQRQAVLDAVFTAATANLTSNQRTAITNLRTNASWNLSREFLVVNREQTEWVALRDALANERIAAKLGESADAGAQAQLANWRAHGSVAAARTGLDESLAQIRTNWNSAASGN